MSGGVEEILHSVQVCTRTVQGTGDLQSATRFIPTVLTVILVFSTILKQQCVKYIVESLQLKCKDFNFYFRLDYLAPYALHKLQTQNIANKENDEFSILFQV